MKYLTTKEIAQRWNISDRRVRKLCEEGRIDCVREEEGRYFIPDGAKKPSDGRFRKRGEAFRYLKWDDEIVGEIDREYNVSFVQPELNEVVSAYTKGQSSWSRAEFEAFLSERIVSRDRRDIEKILFRCGLSVYDTIRVALITRAVNSKDLLWIAERPDERFQEATTEVFSSIFVKKTDLSGKSVDTPEGYNIKRYGVYNGRYGIYKKRLSPLHTDVESEVAVYLLAKRLGAACCPAYRIDEDTVFSEFLYDFAKEYLVHFRRLVPEIRSENEYLNLISARPRYMAEILRMLAIDFLTRQDDRHLSNIAVKVSEKGESFYPLYDNGRSLFYEDTPETVERACSDIASFATSFGPSGTYYDYIRDAQRSGVQFSRLLDLDLTDAEIREILGSAGFKDYRLEGGVLWISKALEILKE